MSMQQCAHIEDTYKRSLTCLTFTNRDVVCGYEDGTMKFFDDSGLEKHSFRHHKGIITCMLYLPAPISRLFVASNDSMISVWNCESVAIKDTIMLPLPVFSLCLYQSKNLIVGLSKEVHIYKLNSQPKCENETVIFETFSFLCK